MRPPIFMKNILHLSKQKHNLLSQHSTDMFNSDFGASPGQKDKSKDEVKNILISGGSVSLPQDYQGS